MELSIILMIIICFAGFTQGLTGFGFSLVALPLLALFLQVREITPILIVLSIITNIMVIFSASKSYKMSELWLMIVFGIVATPLGAYLLNIIEPNILKASVGFIISLTAMFLLFDYKIKIKHKKTSQAITGIFSGLLNGSLSLSGPPIILYMSNQGAKKNELRASFSLFALITNIFAVCAMYYANLINIDTYRYLYIFAPALIIGVSLGIWISKRVKERIFKLITLYVLIIMGIWTFINSGLI